MKPQCVTILMKAIEQYFHVVLVFLFCFVFFTVNYAVQGGSNFQVCG